MARWACVLHVSLTVALVPPVARPPSHVVCSGAAYDYCIQSFGCTAEEADKDGDAGMTDGGSEEGGDAGLGEPEPPAAIPDGLPQNVAAPLPADRIVPPQWLPMLFAGYQPRGLKVLLVLASTPLCCQPLHPKFQRCATSTPLG